MEARAVAAGGHTRCTGSSVRSEVCSMSAALGWNSDVRAGGVARGGRRRRSPAREKRAHNGQRARSVGVAAATTDACVQGCMFEVSLREYLQCSLVLVRCFLHRLSASRGRRLRRGLELTPQDQEMLKRICRSTSRPRGCLRYTTSRPCLPLRRCCHAARRAGRRASCTCRSARRPRRTCS